MAWQIEFTAEADEIFPGSIAPSSGASLLTSTDGLRLQMTQGISANHFFTSYLACGDIVSETNAFCAASKTSA
jgi:hypothetical protein